MSSNCECDEHGVLDALFAPHVHVMSLLQWPATSTSCGILSPCIIARLKKFHIIDPKNRPESGSWVGPIDSKKAHRLDWLTLLRFRGNLLGPRPFPAPGMGD